MEYLYLFLLLFGKPVYLYLYASNLSIARTNRRLYRYKDLPHSFFSCLPLRTVHFEMNSTALHYYKCIHQDWHKIIWHQTCHCISIDSFRLEFSRACAQANRRSRCLFVSRAFLRARQPFSPLSTSFRCTVLIDTCTPVDSSQSFLSGGLARCLSVKDSLTRVRSSLRDDFLGRLLVSSSLIFPLVSDGHSDALWP